MRKRPDYLKLYADRYRLTRREDGIWHILTRHSDFQGTTYDVYDHSDELLAACLPPRAAKHLLNQRPGTFTVHQDADDGMVLLFEEARLDELADALRARRRKRLTIEQRQTQTERLRPFQFTGAGEDEKIA